MRMENGRRKVENGERGAMPRYAYDKLVVSCLHSVEFGPGELRAAVECLRAIPDDRPDKS